MEPTAASQLVGASPEEERSSIQALLTGASLEISSQDPAEIDASAGLLEPGTAVYISMPPGQTCHGTVALAARIKRAGFRPMPHVAARRIAASALDAALAAKKSLALWAGLDLQVVTQFCFEPEPVLSWAARMKGHGLPARIGLAGPASLPRLLRFAALCGIGNSVRALKARPQAITRLLVEAGPEVVVRELARRGGAPIAGVHFFCFGGLVRTARWLRAIREGRFELTSDGGFRVGTA